MLFSKSASVEAPVQCAYLKQGTEPPGTDSWPCCLSNSRAGRPRPQSAVVESPRFLPAVCSLSLAATRPKALLRAAGHRARAADADAQVALFSTRLLTIVHLLPHA